MKIMIKLKEYFILISKIPQIDNKMRNFLNIPLFKDEGYFISYPSF